MAPWLLVPVLCVLASPAGAVLGPRGPPNRLAATKRCRGERRQALLAKGRRQDPGRKGEEEAPFPPDSETIEGPDCGHAKEVIYKWSKAKEVGTAAGKARGAIDAATGAGNVLQAAIDHATEVGAAIAGDEGEVPEALTLALEGSGGAGAVEKATAAATALETELEAFKATASGSPISGADVAAADMRTLQELTEDAMQAAKSARGAAVELDEKAATVKDEALKSTDTTMRLIKKVLEDAEPTVAEAKDIGQKLGWAVTDATAVGEQATELVPKIAEAAAAAEEQAPVVEAMGANLELAQADVTESTEALPPLGDTLTTDVEALETEITTLKDAYATAEGGTTVPTMGEQLTTADIALEKVKEDISNIKAKVKTMVQRQKRLEETIAEAEGKIGA